MLSMTGYGKGTYKADGVELTAEVKSVNNRFLDVAVKSPRIFLAQEEKIRAAVRRHISRGHVDVFVSYTDKREKQRAMAVDLNAARGYYAAAEALRAAFPDLKDDVSLSFYLRLPDVVRAEEGGGADEVLERALEAALRKDGFSGVLPLPLWLVTLEGDAPATEVLPGDLSPLCALGELLARTGSPKLRETLRADLRERLAASADEADEADAAWDELLVCADFSPDVRPVGPGRKGAARSDGNQGRD